LSAQKHLPGDPPVTPLDAREDAAWRGLLRAHAAVVGDLDAELRAAHDLTISDYEVLRFLDDAPDGRLRPSELASAALLTPSGITRLCDRLERQGLVRRESFDEDGRGSLVVLTDDGRRRSRAARATHLAGVRRRFLSRLDPAEIDVLGDVWRRVTDRSGL
jgi:DNA-binding MarR family transcriptional regulator